MTGTTKIELVQVRDAGHRTIKAEKLLNAEVGEKIGPFVVENIEETECSHEERTWRLDEQTSKEAPTVTGRCRACGNTVEKDLSEVF